MRTRINTPDYVFLVLVGVLVLFGLLILASASSVISYEKFGSSFYLIRHQIMFGLLPGVALCLIALRLSPDTWRRLSLPFLLGTLFLLALVVIPFFGTKLGGARSWFTIGAISFQPSELAKLGVILYLAAWAEHKKNVLRDFKNGFVPFFGIVGVVALLILLQPDVGTLAIVGAVVLFLAFSVGIRVPYLLGTIAAGALLLVVLIRIAPYRAARITSFVHPETDPQGAGYHINQALLAVGSGGFWGVGFGHSRQKFRYLPEVTGDSIFPIAAEELGFFVSAGLILLMAAIVWRIFRIARDVPDHFSKYAAVGIAGWFGIQSFVNISSMLGVLPLTGLPLPFVSYGGSALMAELMAVGVVGSISRNAT